MADDEEKQKAQTASERKRRKRAIDQKRFASSVMIGDAISQWKRLRDRMGLDNEELAAVLILHYEEHKNCTRLGASSSTPLSLREQQPSRSDTDSEQSVTSVCLSGIQSLKSSDMSEDGIFEVTQESKSGSEDEATLIEEELFEEDLMTTSLEADAAALDLGDYTWEPSMSQIELSEDSLLSDDQPEGYPAEEVFDVNFDDSDGIESEDEEEDTRKKGRKGFIRQDDAQKASTSEKCISYTECIMELANINVPSTCSVKGCSKQVSKTSRRKGTALYLSWDCTDGHCVRSWCSQPKLPRGVQAGDFALAATIVLSGNNYTKIAMLCRFLNLGCVNRSSFNRIQTLYVCPSINKFWEKCLSESVERAQGKEVIVAGDGRMDSPGFSAKYCTYTMLDSESLDILSMRIVDKRETELKSPNMEMKGFKDAMAELREKKVDVREVVTDAHIGIAAHMRKNEPHVKHSWDVWHGAKSQSKKLAALAAYKANRSLQPWRGDIINHFWHSCETCGKDEALLAKKWTGVVHHVKGEHEWMLGQCDHEPLDPEKEQEKEYVEPDSDAHKALTDFVFDDRLLRNLGHFANYRSTAQLEGFQNHIIMYAGKRFAYSYPVYRARCELAAIDYQMHKNRALAKTKDGKQKYHRSYNKNSVRWTAYEVKEDKAYEYIPVLLEDIFRARIEDTGSIARRVEFMEGDPRRISRTIAPVPPPGTEDIISQKKSRFQ